MFWFVLRKALYTKSRVAPACRRQCSDITSRSSVREKGSLITSWVRALKWSGEKTNKRSCSFLRDDQYRNNNGFTVWNWAFKKRIFTPWFAPVFVSNKLRAVLCGSLFRRWFFAWLTIRFLPHIGHNQTRVELFSTHQISQFFEFSRQCPA